MTDRIHRFIFEKLDIRGALVQLDTSWQAMQYGRNYVASVRDLLGETTAVTALIGSQLKTPGRLTFQVQGKGELSLLVVDCDEQMRLRGMAKASEKIVAASMQEMVGGGQLMLTIQNNMSRQPYQSYVPLEGESVAAVFENYLRQSEQQPTRLFLFADGDRACGLFLQTLPNSHDLDADGWNRVQQLAATIKPEEFALPAEQLLQRLFFEEEVRLFEPREISYYCPRDEEKVRNMLLSLGREEVEHILAEQGEIVIRDDICNQEYRYDAGIVEELFSPANRILH